MATSVTYVGNSYSVPAYNDTGYAQGAGNLSSYLVALATGSLTLSGGAFTLTADANFGASFGLIALYFKSQAANIAASGVLRLASSDLIAWRNNANSADVQLTKNSSDNLNWPNAIVLAAIISAASNPSATGVVRLADVDGINWRNHANSADISLAKNTSDQLTYAGAVFLSSAGIVPISAGGTNNGSALTGSRLIRSTATQLVEDATITDDGSGNLAAIASLASGTVNPATAGYLRLASGDAINWRNNANAANIALAKNASDQLTYNGTAIINSSGVYIGGTIAVAQGGTGVTSSTGTVAVVLSTSPTLITPTLGVAAATSINFGGTALNTYQEGTWTPTDGSGASLSFTVTSATYTRIGRVVFITMFISYPSTANGSSAQVNGLPYTVNSGNVYGAMQNISISNSNNIIARFQSGTTNMIFANQSGAQLTNANLSTLQIIMNGFFIV